MSNYKARQIHLIRRPVGMPTHDDFAMVEVELQPPDDGEVLVQNRFMSVDPYMRGRMLAEASYAAPSELNTVQDGGGLGEWGGHECSGCPLVQRPPGGQA